MQIHCFECKAVIQADQINLDRCLAKCLSCHNVFRFDPDAGAAAGALSDSMSASLNPAGPSGAYGPGSTQRPAVPVPQEFSLQRDGGTLLLSWRWFNLGHVFMLVFCIAWNSFLLFWYGMALGAPGPVDLIMVLFPIGHVAVGVCLTWATIAGFLNRTVVRASPELLSVVHAPIWMPGQHRIEPAQVSQLFCRERISHSRNGTSVSYETCVLLRDGKELKLVQFSRPEQAAFVEQQLERHLGLADRPVAGEMARVY